MSKLHIKHIVKAFEKAFSSVIDMSDYTTRPANDRQDKFLTRSLAAYCLVMLAGLSEADAASAVTDEYNDNGIDAIHYDEQAQTLYIIQSKWHNSGSGSIDQGSILKFTQGVQYLIEDDFSTFGPRMQQKRDMVQNALSKTNTLIKLIVIYSGTEKLSKEVVTSLNKYVDDINDGINDDMSYRSVCLKEIHSHVSKGASADAIEEVIYLREWGKNVSPYNSYYGKMAASDLGELWVKYESLLFEQNLRTFIGSSEVNESIKNTIKEQPKKFWYLNNGVTIICQSMEKTKKGGGNRDVGVFSCKGLSVVNGAQTVGCIGSIAKQEQKLLSDVYVNVRFISMAKAPSDFASEITRAANTQNRIEKRDFAALDPEQERLRNDLLLGMEKKYTYKTGERFNDQQNECNIEEATIALACLKPQIHYSVLAKSGVGKLWESIHSAPYIDIFNSKTHASQLWNAVSIMRCVDSVLDLEKKKRTGREKMVIMHGNRFILHCVFQKLGIEQWDIDEKRQKTILQKARRLTSRIAEATFTEIETKYHGAYLNSLFKNFTKCGELQQAILKRKSTT